MLLESPQLISQLVKDTIPMVTSIIRDTVYIQQNSYEWLDLANIASMLTALVAIISVIVSNQSTKKQLEISERQLKETTENFTMEVEANRKQMRDDNLIKIRKEWMLEFSNISCSISQVLYKITMVYLMRSAPGNLTMPEDTSEKTEAVKYPSQDHIDELQFLDNQLKLKLTLEGEELTVLHTILDDFLKDLFTEQNLSDSELKNKLAGLTINFEKESQNIIRRQIEKLIA